ncbi:uncharacterized protein LOC122246052 [Penaeus japonicus]|uniref:uncharacterized protein LOC122246052 n=1 Tax=Penaeus japonicus TaxID=27405 RepID=UPI001C70F9A1|nr:uncharacterized protein LOC122246052 [Penaeus japonicus]
MLRRHGAVAALLCGFMLMLMILTASRDIPSTPIRAPVVLAGQEHPTLSRKCFLYSNVTAENICCRMHPYKQDTDILQCVRRANTKALSSLRKMVSQTFPESNVTDDAVDRQSSGDLTADLMAGRVDWTLPTQAGDLPGLPGATHWVLVGDSHLRYVFDVLMRRSRGVGLQYRKQDYEEWRPAQLLLKAFRLGTTDEDFKIRHLAVPFRLTFHWDPLLKRLPALIESWESNRHLAPSLVILGKLLCWMGGSLSSPGLSASC